MGSDLEIIGAPCRFRPTAYGSWCELHSTPIDNDDPDRAIMNGRCPNYERFFAQYVLPSSLHSGSQDAG